ncbi:MAG: hypothetical protein HY709_12235 [Candidatus Latescibacteria bacterium]|nr:hypothetical protein [Candidatus Latescibacterota bacterium]
MDAEKVMFEIYREAMYTDRYRVVYFTELNESNKDQEINRALSGEHVYDGFLRRYRLDEAKRIIDGFIERLNNGEHVDTGELDKTLAPYTPS